MKKLVLLVLGSVMMISCGRDKKEDLNEVADEAVKTNSYSVVFQAIYQNDDELVLQYKPVDGYMEYDKPVKQNITGKPDLQTITVKIPDGVALANFQFFVSSNKDQKLVDIKNVSVLNNNKEVYNSGEFLFSKDFVANVGVTYDEKNKRTSLIYGGEYPPGFSGTEQLEAYLDK